MILHTLKTILYIILRHVTGKLIFQMGSGGYLGFMQKRELPKFAILATKLFFSRTPLDYESRKKVHRKEHFKVKSTILIFTFSIKIENHYIVVWCYATLKMNEYIETDIWFLIFWSNRRLKRKRPKNAIHLISSCFVNCKVIIRVCLLIWWKGTILQCQYNSSSVKHVSENTIILVSL